MFDKLFLSVGAMKAGTTWAYNVLKQHPEIAFCNEKEVHYFAHVNGVANSLDTEKRKRRAERALHLFSSKLQRNEISLDEMRDYIKWYLEYSCSQIDDSWFERLYGEQAVRDSYCADFSNLNCFLSGAGWDHVKRISKKVKVIYILRDPLSRLWSHYKFHLKFIGSKNKINPIKDFKNFQEVIKKPWFLRNSQYIENIETIKSKIAEQDFKIFFLEEISAQPRVFLKDIHEFLGIKDFNYPGIDLEERKNVTADVTIPKEWLSEAHNLLSEEIHQLKLHGVWHESWLNPSSVRNDS